MSISVTLSVVTVALAFPVRKVGVCPEVVTETESRTPLNPTTFSHNPLRSR